MLTQIDDKEQWKRESTQERLDIQNAQNVQAACAEGLRNSVDTVDIILDVYHLRIDATDTG